MASFSSPIKTNLYPQQHILTNLFDDSNISFSTADRMILFVKQQLELQLQSDLSVNTSLGSRKLTLLHLSVICDDLELTEILFDKGANPNSGDIRNWTPLHHAALANNQRMIQVLLNKGANPKAKTTYEGTYKDILRLAYQSKALVQDEKLPFVQLNDCDYPPCWLFEHWKNGVFIGLNEVFFSDLAETYRCAYEDYRKHPIPRLLITESSATTGVGVYSENDVKAQSVVGEYIGVIKSSGFCGVENDYASHYVNGFSIDAKEKGGICSRINDGFPNVGLVFLQKSHQMPVRRIFIALEDVKASETIYFHYGMNHPVKHGPYLEMRPKELREFVAGLDIEVCRKYRNSRFDSTDFDSFAFEQKLLYLQNTPPVIFSLILDGSMNEQFAREFVNIFHIYRNNMIKPTAEAAIACRTIYLRYHPIAPNFASKFLTYFLQLPSVEKMMDVEHKAKRAEEIFNQFNIPEGLDPLEVDKILLQELETIVNIKTVSDRQRTYRAMSALDYVKQAGILSASNG